MGRDSADHEQRSRAAIDAVQEFLGGPDGDGQRWSFEFPEHLESNWGAVFGGALAAGTLAVARAAAPARSPRSLHLQMVRSVPRGPAYATAEMRHAGRTVATVQVDLYDARGKLAVTALVTMVDPAAVVADRHDASADPWQVTRLPHRSDAWSAPITDALDMTGTGFYVDNMTDGIGGSRPTGLTFAVPWASLDVTGPEAACLAADAVTAAPIVEVFGFDGEVGPNTDLSLRFSTAPAAEIVRAVGTMVSIQHGTTTVAIEVQAGDNQLARGLSTSLLLPPR